MIENTILSSNEVIRCSRYFSCYTLTRLFGSSIHAFLTYKKMHVSLKLSVQFEAVSTALSFLAHFFPGLKPRINIIKTANILQRERSIDFILLLNTVHQKIFLLLFFRYSIYLSLYKTKTTFVSKGLPAFGESPINIASFSIKVPELPTLFKTKAVDLYGFSYPLILDMSVKQIFFPSLFRI